MWRRYDNLGQIFCLQLLFCSPDSVSVAILRLATLHTIERKTTRKSESCMHRMCVRNCCGLDEINLQRCIAYVQVFGRSMCEKHSHRPMRANQKQQEKLKSDNGNGIHRGKTYLPFGSIRILALHSFLLIIFRSISVRWSASCGRLNGSAFYDSLLWTSIAARMCVFVCARECSFRIFAHSELFSHFVRIFIQIVLRFTMFMIITEWAKDVVGSSQILRRQFLVNDQP